MAPLGYPLRCIEQAFARRVFANLDQQFTYQSSDFFRIRRHGSYFFGAVSRLLPAFVRAMATACLMAFFLVNG